MKKKILILISTLTFLLGASTYSAACNSEEINALAQDVRVYSYGVEAFENQPNDEVYLVVENIPEDMYVIVINDTLNTKKTYKEFENGMLEVKTPSASTLYSYTIKLHSSSSECENELIKTFKKKTLVYNSWTISTECDQLRYEMSPENMDDFEEKEEFDGCRKFTEKVYTEKTFYNELEKYKNNQPEEIERKVVDLFYKYYYFALIPVAILGIYYVIRLALIKRRKKKDEEQ